MIPRDYITAWRQHVPWVDEAQVEQDLVISRALVEIFSRPLLHEALAFRGGTALYKLHLKPVARYSEDIDLVQTRAEAAGPMMDELRRVLNPWLGEPAYRQSAGRVTFSYRFTSEGLPPVTLKLKVETNTREHFSVYGLSIVPFTVKSPWFAGDCQIQTYDLNELLGTKLRALFQRAQGRDLFDLATALHSGKADPARIVEAFAAYMKHDGTSVSRQVFERNLAGKMKDAEFTADIGPLLAAGHEWNIATAAAEVSDQILALLPDSRSARRRKLKP